MARLMRVRGRSSSQLIKPRFLATTTSLNIPSVCISFSAYCYRPHSRGDNTFGSVRVYACVFVRPFVRGRSPV